MTDVTKLTAAELARKLAAKELSAVEVATAHLDRIDAVEGKVHAFLHVDRDGALKAAKDVDDARAKGETKGPLAGVPIAVKDVITTKGCRPPRGRRSWRAGGRPTTRRS
ncbi:hypothetical protein GCM10027610_135780 [Dactylosporangium cerinum]